LFDNTYQRYLIKTFRDTLPFRDVPIKIYLRHKRRTEQPPLDEADAANQPDAKKAPLDLSHLEFRSTITDEELEREVPKYESELWNDL
jgi:GTP-binding protein